MNWFFVYVSPFNNSTFEQNIEESKKKLSVDICLKATSFLFILAKRIKTHTKMNRIKCKICFENLQKPTENRGGIRVAICGHPFHTNCITTIVRQ